MPPLGFALSCSLLPFGFGFSVLLVLLLEWLAPHVIPFDLSTFWAVEQPLWTAFSGSFLLAWPAMAGGLLLTLVSLPRIRHVQRQLAWQGSADGQVIKLGPVRLVLQSALEEILFRWLLFYAAIAGAVFVDFLVLGFADLHPVRWIFTEVFIPVADFATAGHLHQVLTEHPWTVAAAMLTSNGRFRNTHGYQGILGWIWSWYMGMFLFLVMFEYGLVAAMAIHIAHNLVTLGVHLVIVGTLPRMVIRG
ncbi:hypothetical protein [Nonomuraea sp. LPB2021202275-12-8]|uniref:hypothetical protein n=1 Tax=Nonomuraea sp. LPB2021202275-12-8 TaxID=3120159 RepID=UPI00300D1F92